MPKQKRFPHRSPDIRRSFGALIAEIYDVPCEEGKTRFLKWVSNSRALLSLKWPESWLSPNSGTRVVMEKGISASLYPKETETGIIGVCGSWSPATFGMWTFTQVRVLSPRPKDVL